MNKDILSLCGMPTLTGGGLRDILLLCALILLEPVDLDYETCVSGLRESTCSQSEGDRLVSRTICLSFFGAPFNLNFGEGGCI